MLGSGAMGCVYLARDTELERDVAIKTVRNSGTPDDQAAFLVRFRNEARAVGRLRHRSIVAVYDVGEDPEAGPYLVFEYIEGSNLKDMLRAQGPLTPGQVIALAEQVGEALDAAHREGIIHRDIKPENLLVGSDGVIRLADFGVARVPDAALTGRGQFLGTPCYGAPETLRGQEAGPLSDQFSFAAVLYEAVSGTRAFPGNDAIAVAHRVVHEDPPPPSKVAQPGAVIPKALDEVILRGLSKQPEARFDQLGSLVAALRSAYGDAAHGDAATLSRTGLADTLPAVQLGQRASRPSTEHVAAKKKVPLWPFALAAAVGVGVVLKFAPSPDALDGVSGGGAQASDALPSTTADEPATPTALAPEAGVNDSGAADAGASEAADASADLPELAGMSAFEREERAKDALDRAQEALKNGDRDLARAALEEAYRFDPEHPDIVSLRNKL